MDAAIFDDLTALADATRSRMLLVLERHELTVSELCAVLQLPQSTVSRHLKTLSDADWVSSRRDGTSRYYTLALDDRGPATRRLWALLREQVSQTPGADQDGRRLRGVLARRQSKSQEFFASAAGQWDRLREDMFGRASYLHALPGLLDPEWIVGDLGCGTGQVAAALAPFVKQVIAVDRSSDMLQAARRRLARSAQRRRAAWRARGAADRGRRARRGDAAARAAPPARSGRSARRSRASPASGRTAAHLRHAAARSRSVSPADGPRLARIRRRGAPEMLGNAGFDHVRIASMPTDPDAKGPALFVAGARRATLKVSCQSQFQVLRSGSWTVEV